MQFSRSGRRRIVGAATGLLVGAGLVLVGPATPSGAQVLVPSFDKAFSPATIGPGSISTLEFTIDNPLFTPVMGLAFSDTLPAGMTIADPAQASTTCTGATLSAPTGGTTISLTGGSVGALATCTVEVDVTTATAGTSTNTSGDLISNVGNSGPASADLVVDTDLPGFTKDFSPDVVDLGERSTLTFTIDNTAGTKTLTSLSFTDTLPAGMTIANPSNASTDCGEPFASVTLTAPAGGTDVSLLVFGTTLVDTRALPPGMACTISVDVKATAFGTGSLPNTSGVLTVSRNSGPAVPAGKAGATLTVQRAPLHIVKNFTGDPIVPGGIATLSIDITNFDRSFDASDVGFTDTLPAGVALATPAGATSNCGGALTADDGGAEVALTGGTIAAGATCTITVSVTASTGGSLVNTTGAVTGTVGGSPVTGNAATETLYVSAAPILTKTYLDNPVAAGTSTTLEFTITNSDGANAASDIAFSDEFAEILPTGSVAGSTCAGSIDFTPLAGNSAATVTLQNGSLGAGATCSFQLELDVVTTAASGGYVNMTSPITATVDGTSVTGAPATDELLVVGPPPMRKTFAADVVAPGGSVDLTFTVINGGEGEGDVDAVGPLTAITFNDDLSAVAGLTFETPLPPDPCGAGSTLSTNVDDNVLTLTDGSLLIDESCSFTVTVLADATTLQGLVTNTTSDVSATALGFTVTGPGASDDLLVTDVTATKEFTDDPVLAGTSATLVFTFVNASPDDVTGISFTDDLANALAGLAFDALVSDTCGGTLTGTTTLSYSGGAVPSGQSCAVTITVSVPGGTDADGYVNATSAIDLVIGTEAVQLPPVSDLLEVADPTEIGLTKEFVDDPVSPGGSVTLRFTLSNPGSTTVTGVAFTDDLVANALPATVASVPASPCGGSTAASTATLIDFAGGTLAPGEECSFDTTLTLSGSAGAGSYPNSTSTVTTDDNVTGAPATDDLVVVVPAERIADVAITKTDDADPVVAGSSLTYTVSVFNAGPDDAEDVVVTDTLPAGVSNPVTSGCAEDPAGVPTCTLGAIASGTTASYTITVDVDTGTSGTITNAASVVTSSTDPDLGNNDTIEDTEVIGEADLSITKTDSHDPAFAGYGLTYTVDVANAGPAEAVNVVVTDVLPAGVTVVSALGCVEAPVGTLTCDAGDLAAGDSTSFTIDVAIDASTLGTITNDASVTSDAPDSNTANNVASEDTEVIQGADLSIEKVDEDDPVEAGDEIKYEITVFNAGPLDAIDVVVTDTLPAGVSFEETDGCDNDDDGVPTCELGTIAAGASKTFEIEVEVDDATAGVVTNTASVTSATPDPDTSNNTASEDTLVVPDDDDDDDDGDGDDDDGDGDGDGDDDDGDDGDDDESDDDGELFSATIAPVAQTPQAPQAPQFAAPSGQLPVTGGDGVGTTLAPALGALVLGLALVATSRRRRLVRLTIRR